MHSEEEIKKKSPFVRAMEIMILLVFGFCGGFAYDFYEYKQVEVSNDELLLETDSLQNIINIYEETIDWNALKNLEVNEIVKGCTRCNPMVHSSFQKLSTEEKRRGRLVVPDRIPEL